METPSRISARRHVEERYYSRALKKKQRGQEVRESRATVYDAQGRRVEPLAEGLLADRVTGGRYCFTGELLSLEDLTDWVRWQMDLPEEYENMVWFRFQSGRKEARARNALAAIKKVINLDDGDDHPGGEGSTYRELDYDPANLLAGGGCIIRKGLRELGVLTCGVDKMSKLLTLSREAG